MKAIEYYYIITLKVVAWRKLADDGEDLMVTVKGTVTPKQDTPRQAVVDWIVDKAQKEFEERSRMEIQSKELPVITFLSIEPN